MKKPVFGNKPNTPYILDEKTVWVSRSAAVNIILFATQKNSSETYVLVEKRSQSMPDGPGLHTVPSGYIDYNENGWDAVRRELYEETGILIDEYPAYIVFDNQREPVYVITEPDDSHQNIVLCYCIVLDFENEKLPDLSNFDKNEVETLEWVPVSKIPLGKYKWGFNHDNVIRTVLEKITKI